MFQNHPAHQNEITKGRFGLGFSVFKHKSVTHDINNCELHLTFKNCSEAFFRWQIEDELCGLHAGVCMWVGSAKLAPPLSQVWHPSRGEDRKGRWWQLW